MLPRAAELLAIDDLEGIKRLVGISAAVWTGFVQQVGDPGTNLHHVAALPPFIVAQACASATLADGTLFNLISATQMGLVAAPVPSPKASGVKEHVLKMASLLDQTDESEFVPAPADQVQAWAQRYVNTI